MSLRRHVRPLTVECREGGLESRPSLLICRDQAPRLIDHGGMAVEELTGRGVRSAQLLPEQVESAWRMAERVRRHRYQVGLARISSRQRKAGTEDRDAAI